MTDPQRIDGELYQYLRQGGSAVLPLPQRAVWRVTGADRVRYLNGQVTNDVTKLAVGHSFQAAVLTGKGKIVGELVIAAEADSLLLDAPLELRGILRDRFEKFLIADDAVFTDLTESGRLAHLFGSVSPAAGPGWTVSAHARFGVPGLDLWQPGEGSFSEGQTATAAGAEVLRIEHGIAAWGREIDENTLPQEILLERGGRGLSYDKGCYVGQETVARNRSIGHVNRLLVLLEQEDGPTAAGTEPIPLHAEDGAEAGRLTSVAWSPRAGRETALALVTRKYAAVGTVLNGTGRRYRLVAWPF